MSALKNLGIAGMASFDAVKCLHCHYAHHLARPQDGNIVGEWVGELLRQQQQEQQQQQQLKELEKITNNDSNQIHQEVDTNNANAIDVPMDNNNCSNDKSRSSIVAAHASSSSSPILVSNQVTPLDPKLLDVPIPPETQREVHRSFEVSPTTSFMCFRMNKSDDNNTNGDNCDSRSSCNIG